MNQMMNPNINQGPREAYRWGDKGIPTRENCNLKNPREMFLWMFTAVPGLNGAALMIPPDMFMVWSEHLYECGARLAEEPVKKYRRPTSNDPHWATSPGQWVPIDTPDPEVNPAEKAWNTLTPIQKAEIRALANAEHEAEPQ